jgi:hypothetical protein
MGTLGFAHPTECMFTASSVLVPKGYISFMSLDGDGDVALSS